MAALPKRKLSKARQGEGHSHIVVKPKALLECPDCHSPKLLHHACPSCGSYRGREVIKIKPAKKTT
jgi:large subunit ribosomal protein L32